MNSAAKLIAVLSVILPLLLHTTMCTAQVSEPEELYIALLIDGSLSMKDTDPSYYRKLASQSVLSMLSPKDNICVVQFANEPDVLLQWTKADNIGPLLSSLDMINANGTTDFYLALKKMTELFSEVPRNARKIILLFSDGELEPNPYSSEYTPHHQTYKGLILGKNQQQRSVIYNEFKQRIIPIAERKIEDIVLPELKSNEVEIFSIAFSPDSDKKFMRYIARETNRQVIEQRFFYVDKATDILEVFMTLLPFWQNKVLLYKESGNIKGTRTGEFFIDEFVKDLYCLSVFDDEVAFELVPQGGSAEIAMPGTHKNLVISQLKNANPPHIWQYQALGNANFNLLILGESTIRIEVENLKPRYLFGEEAELNIKVKIGDRDARSILSNKPRVEASIYLDGDLIDSKNLIETPEGYQYKYQFNQTGDFTARFTLKSLDDQGRELLPRPSREYQFQVLPRFTVLPAHLSLGSVRKGGKASFKLIVINGLTEERILTTTCRIIPDGRRKISDGLPYIDTILTSPPNTQKEFPLAVCIPPKTKNWGDFKGEILLNSNTGEEYIVTFRLHIPSWIEKIGYVFTTLLIILLAGFIYMIYKWSNLKSPVGILRIIEHPLGDLKRDIKLSHIKKGFWSKYLNWNKNVVRLGSSKSNVKLHDIPFNAAAELIFFRIGNDYIKNNSPKDSSFTITVERSDVRVKITLQPGKHYPLSNGLKIGIGGYVIIY
ncbi:MAG: VWA domain-containing protein, partial [Bacteroidales bacterium]|nr:VWA domain-containing protein [Bacteroidales bacterium]